MGFTVFELLVGTLIVATLASVLLPAFARTREAARIATCRTNLHQLGMVLRLYADEHEGSLPWSGGNGDARGLNALFPDYLQDPLLFVCPSSSSGSYEMRGPQRVAPYPTGFGEEGGLRVSYDYLGAYTPAPLTLPHPSRPLAQLPILWDLDCGLPEGASPQDGYGRTRSHFTGGNVLMLDGSAYFLHARQWAAPNLPLASAAEVLNAGNDGANSEPDQ